jgi:hypothetical protein
MSNRTSLFALAGRKLGDRSACLHRRFHGAIHRQSLRRPFPGPLAPLSDLLVGMRA